MSLLFKKVLIALPDEIENAVEVTRVGMSIARALDADVRLVSVLSAGIAPTPTSVGMPAGDVLMPPTPSVSETEIEKRKAIVSKILSAHTARTNADQVVRVGSPPNEIVLEADSWEADLIVIAARDRNWLERFFEPSISRSVARHAKCAVMILPDEMPLA